MQLRLNNNKFDLTIENRELVLDGTPISDVISSIFTNISWYGHSYSNSSGSILGNTINAGRLTIDELNELTASIKDSCQWLLNAGKIKNIEIKRVINNRYSKVELHIIITLPNHQIFNLMV